MTKDLEEPTIEREEPPNKTRAAVAATRDSNGEADSTFDGTREEADEDPFASRTSSRSRKP